MKRIISMTCLATLIFASCTNENKTGEKTSAEATTDATQSPKEEAWVPVDSAIMMKNMMEYGTTGPMHQLLASWSGTWKGETTMWDYEGAAPQKSTGTAVNAMIFGGKYQTSTHTGDMMGMPFEGRTIMAYDNALKKFTSAWIDTWSTGIMNFTGSWDESSKKLTMTGTYPDIHRPGKECTMREVITVIDDNNQKMEMYGPDFKTGKEYKMFEIAMKRIKK